MTTIDPDECDHPISSREKGTRVIEGETVRVEICGKCGLVMVHPSDAARVLSVKGRHSAPRLRGAKEVILALLGVVPDRPIINRLGLMKEAFLLEKESAPVVGLSLDALGFVPYKQGPFSRELSDAVDELATAGILKVEHQGRQQRIGLTPEGKVVAGDILRGLGEEPVKKLAHKRRAWDQLGYNGILRKVYEEYPAYTSESEIVDRIKPGGRAHKGD
jgi:hypothetical protein